MSTPSENLLPEAIEKRIWTGALLCFLVAGSTGVYLRSIQLLGIPSVLSLPGFEVILEPGNIRHAHSHLMYFGWVTPLLLMMSVRGSRAFDTLLKATLVLAGLSYVPFLLFGYEFAPLRPGMPDTIRLPLSIAVSTSTILVWYAFVNRYRKVRSSLEQGPGRPFHDASLVFLTIASLGAWGLGIVMALEPANPVWYQLTLHLFLDLFAEGWLLTGVIGLAVTAAAAGTNINSESENASRTRFHTGIRRAWLFLVVGIPPMFLLGIHPGMLPEPVRLLGSAGAVISSMGLVLFIRHSRGRLPAIWRLPVGLLSVKVVGNLAVAVSPLAEWGLGAGLRIPYLHLILLGVITPGLLAGVASSYGPTTVRGWSLLGGAVVLMLLSMIPLTGLMSSPGLMPGLVSAKWIARIVVTGAALPVVAMTSVFLFGVTGSK